VNAIESIDRMLSIRANAEHGQPHRPAILAWFSNRPETPAGDVGMWARDIVRGLLVQHGTLAAWHATSGAAEARLKLVRNEAMEGNRLAAADSTTDGIDATPRRERGTSSRARASTSRPSFPEPEPSVTHTY
jgi:hypothetical protein